VAFAVNGSDFERQTLGGGAYGGRLASVWGNNLTTKFAVNYNDKGLSKDIGIFLRNPGPRVNVFGGTSVVRQTDHRLSSTLRARATLARMSEAVAVQMNGLGCWL